jgi:polar amino acid transport system permease protein
MTLVDNGSKVASTDIAAIDVASAKERKRPVYWLASVAVFLAAVMVVVGTARNKNIEWATVFEFFTSEAILEGLWTTIWLTAGAMVLGVVGGILLAYGRLSRNALFRYPADLFVWFFRGTPLLIQLIFWYNFAIFLPRVELPVPFTDFYLLSESTNDLITPLTAAVLGLALHEAAYMCEIVRAGVQGVPKGQVDAGLMVGLSGGQVNRQIVLPQAMRIIIPPTGNQAISMLKASSLVSVMSVSDLFYSAQAVYTNNGKVVPLLVVAAIWYLILTSVLYVIQARIERHYGGGAFGIGQKPRKPGFWSKATGRLKK